MYSRSHSLASLFHRAFLVFPYLLYRSFIIPPYRDHLSSIRSKYKMKGNNKTINQVNMEKLEMLYGKVMPVNEIWSTFKSNAFDLAVTLRSLNKMHPEVKLDANILLPEVNQHETVIEEESTKKPPLRTSEEVYKRIKWDPDYDKRDFIIGYIDRFDGLMEAPFEIFETGDVSTENFVPWHRVQYFKKVSTDTILWDRRIRKDDIFAHQ